MSEIHVMSVTTAASDGSDQTVSTLVIGLITLLTTVVIMYVIARRG